MDFGRLLIFLLITLGNSYLTCYHFRFHYDILYVPQNRSALPPVGKQCILECYYLAHMIWIDCVFLDMFDTIPNWGKKW